MPAKIRENSFFAFLVTATLAAAIIVIALQRPIIFPMAFIFVVVATMAVGLPLYLFVRAQQWINGGTAAVAGAITGAALPLALILLAFSSGSSLEGAPWRMVAMFALLGAVMGLVFYTMLRWGGCSRRAHIGLGTGMAVLAAAGIAFFQFGFDHSCHNTAILGVIARYPGTSFTVSIPQSEWPKLRNEIERFGRERGWSALREFDGPDSVEICTPPATLIYAKWLDGEDAQARYMVSTEEPLRDNPDFRAEFRRLLILHDRIVARWPGAVSASNSENLRFIASPDGKPSPTPSSAVR